MPAGVVEQLDLLGISGVANMLSAIKMAKWYELGRDDVVLTVLTDSMELYGSRLTELTASAASSPTWTRPGLPSAHLMGRRTDYVEELSYRPQARPQPEVLHLGRAAGQDLRRDPGPVVRARLLDAASTVRSDEIDELIDEFNAKVGLL